MRTKWRLLAFDSLPSTSDLCISHARNGAPEGLVVLARQQTAARGSRGRPWSSPPGSLCASVLLRPNEAAERAGWWSLLAGVALADTLAGFISDPRRISLKWPNDVLLDDAKLAGILIDSAVTPRNTLDWLVLGMGANLRRAPEVGRPAAGLDSDVSPEIVVDRLLLRLDEWRERDVHAAWLARAHPIGARMSFRHGETVMAGIFAGISPSGALALMVDGQRREFSAGNVIETTDLRL